MQDKNTCIYTKTVCDSEIVSSELKQLRDKKLVRITEVRNIEKIKKYFPFKVKCFRAESVKYDFDLWSIIIIDKEVVETISSMPISIFSDLKGN